MQARSYKQKYKKTLAELEKKKTKMETQRSSLSQPGSEIECKVGGKYNHVMTIDGVGEHPGEAVFKEYDPPNRICFVSEGMGGPGTEMTVTVDFTEVDGGTRVTLVHEGIPDMRVDGDVELRDIIRDGWSAGLAKLGNFLSTPA